jgi:hypothetical protein
MPTFNHLDSDFDPIEYEIVEKPWGKRLCARIVIKNCDGTDHETPRVYGSVAEAQQHLDDDLEFTVRYWGEQLNMRDRAVVCGGTHYRVGKETSAPAQHRGFGGSGFTFKDIATGEVIRSSNVWFQGIVPAFARNALPDTHTMGE